MTEWDLKQVCLRSAGPVTELSCSFKELNNLGMLVSLTSLVRLNVSFNCLTQLNCIRALQQLQSLNISHNRLTTSGIEGLSSLRGLTQLICSHNRISSTEALVQLPDLQFLALHSNSINTAGDVLALSSLTKLQHITLGKNPVCKQENWEDGVIALLPGLQALDSIIITAEQRAAASAHSEVWEAAGQQVYSCSSTPREANSSAASECSDGAGAAQTVVGGDPGQHGGVSSAGRLSSRTSSGSAGRLRPRGSAPELDDSISIKDATSLLPSMTLKPLKPSTVVRRPAEAPQPSKYGYSRAKPVKVLHKQTYPATGSPAVLIHSDGSASLSWPEGSMAATLDPENHVVPGSMASTSSSAGAPAPIKGYRLLAMYRTITGVAASFDSTGGFVQWPSGQLMLVWNRKDGTAYGPDGRVTHTFNNRRKPPGALQEDISARLDQHLCIRFLAGSHELQLFYSCDGCQAVLSQQHGAVLPDRAVAQEAAMQQSGQQPGQQPESHASGISSRQEMALESCSQLQQQAQQHKPEQMMGRPGEGSSAGAAAIAGLPAGGDMQALLARARALMAATDLSQSEVAVDQPSAAEPEQAAVPVDQQAAAVQGISSQPCQQDQEASAAAGCDDEGDLQAMMARARAAIAATSAALQDLTV